MNEYMVTIGCVMALASEQGSGEITSTQNGEPVLTFCFLSESEDHKLIPTSQARKFCEIGFLPIGIAQIDPDHPGDFLLRALNGLSAELRFALEHKAADLICSALNGYGGHAACN
jgi:hypothetical protein